LFYTTDDCDIVRDLSTSLINPSTTPLNLAQNKQQRVWKNRWTNVMKAAVQVSNDAPVGTAATTVSKDKFLLFKLSDLGMFTSFPLLYLKRGLMI